MKTATYGYKGAARMAGILYIIGTVAGVISTRFIGGDSNALKIGALLTLAMGFSLALIPAFMFPILKKYSEAAGVGYIIFRGALETCTYIIKAVCLLALSSIGTNTAIQAISDSSVTAFAFGIGALIFYTALYKYRLIPRWLSAFGLIGAFLHIVSGALVIFGLQENFDTGSMIMNLPIAAQEMIMAVWLIVKGFSIVNGGVENVNK